MYIGAHVCTCPYIRTDPRLLILIFMPHVLPIAMPIIVLILLFIVHAHACTHTSLMPMFIVTLLSILIRRVTSMLTYLFMPILVLPLY